MNVVGEKLCPACRDNCEIPHPCDDCAVAKVLEVGEPVEKKINIRGKNYRLTANPISTARGSFVVVMVLPDTTIL